MKNVNQTHSHHHGWIKQKRERETVEDAAALTTIHSGARSRRRSLLSAFVATATVHSGGRCTPSVIPTTPTTSCAGSTPTPRNVSPKGLGALAAPATATRYKTLQRTATHYSTLQHTQKETTNTKEGTLDAPATAGLIDKSTHRNIDTSPATQIPLRVAVSPSLSKDRDKDNDKDKDKDKDNDTDKDLPSVQAASVKTHASTIATSESVTATKDSTAATRVSITATGTSTTLAVAAVDSNISIQRFEQENNFYKEKLMQIAMRNVQTVVKAVARTVAAKAVTAWRSVLLCRSRFVSMIECDMTPSYV